MIKFSFLISTLFVFSLTAYSQETNDIEKNIDKYLTYFSGENPGAVVAVYKKGEIIFNKAYGLANVETKKVMKVDQLFNLRELSKAFTSLAVMQLAEKNKLSLDDNLGVIFNGFPEYGQKVQVKHLLDHTSGLEPYNGEEIKSSDELINFLKKQDKLVFDPGTKSKFSNSEYALLAKIVELKSGMSYSDFLKKNIFKKLKLNNTYFTHELNESNSIAIGHFKNDEKQYEPELVLNNFYGEQGIFTNVQDYAKWDQVLYTDKLLKCESLQKIFRVEKLTDKKSGSDYTSGWALMKRNNTRYYWQGGMGTGYTNLVLHLPDTQTTVLILTNRNDGYDFLKMALYIAKEFDKDLNILD